VRPDSPFAFVVISNSQENPEVVKKIATMAYAQRPNFTLHCGDLVSDGHIHTYEPTLPIWSVRCGLENTKPQIAQIKNLRNPHYYPYIS